MSLYYIILCFRFFTSLTCSYISLSLEAFYFPRVEQISLSMQLYPPNAESVNRLILTLSLVHLIFHIRLKVRCGRLESMQVSTLVFARERKDRWGMMLDEGGKHPPPGSSLLLFLSLEMKPHVLTCKCCGRGRESRMLRLGSTCIANQLNPPSKLRECHARLYWPFNEIELNQKQIGCAFFGDMRSR